jgi:MFS family permease
MLRVLRRRSFALLWTSGLISMAGDWVLYAALPFYVFQRTGSTVATAGMVVAELLPGALLGTVAGVFVDRWSRKRVLVVANALQAAVVACLALVQIDGWLWIVYVVAAAQSSVAAFAGPAENALLPTLVDDGDLVPANALNALNNRLARLAGLPVGGFLLALGGIVPVVIADVASFLLAAALLIGVRQPASAPTAPGVSAESGVPSAWRAVWAEWLDGFRLIARDRAIRVLFVVFGFMTFGGTMLDPLTAAWVIEVLGGGPEVYAGLMTVSAVAGIAGTLALGTVAQRLPPRGLMGWGSVVAGLISMAMYLAGSIAVAFGLNAARGVTAVAASIGVDTTAQRTVPDSHRGRVFGALGASGALLSLLGATTGGVLAEAVGTVTMLCLASGLLVFAGVVVLLALPREDASPAA